MMMNSGQSCNAPSRMLVPNSRKDEAIAVAQAVAEQVKVGDPDDKSAIGPVASKAQFDKIQGLIQKGIDEGATVVVGGPGRPDGLDTGYYVKPTVFADVKNDMTIAREEIFGPVLCILGYDDVDQAVEIANDTEYGLAGYVSGADLDQARAVARRIRAGSVAINHAFDMNAPFGGYKQAAATDASGASSGSTTTWRSRASSATRRRRQRVARAEMSGTTNLRLCSTAPDPRPASRGWPAARIAVTRWLIGESFWPDATIDFGIFAGSFDEYLAWVVPGSPAISVTQHILGQTLIELDGDAALAETHVTAYHRVDGDDGERDTVIGGRYLDRLGEAWRRLAYRPSHDAL